MEKEIWKPIGVFKGVDLTAYYQASNMGRIKRLARIDNTGCFIPEKILDRNPNKYGDIFVTFSFDGKVICGTASQFIMNTFHPDHDPAKNRIRHIDGNKANNRLDNLEWATQKEICTQGTFTEKQAQVLREKVTPVVQLDLNGNLVAEYRLRDDIRNAGFTSESIIGVINKKKYYRKGFIWMYKPDYENSTIKDIKAIAKAVTDRENKRRRDIGKANRRPVLQLDMDGNLIAEYESLTKAAKAVGCTKQAISLCLVEPLKYVSCVGYMWRYKK